MLQQRSDHSLIVSDFLFIFCLFRVKLGAELLNLFFLLVQNLKLLILRIVLVIFLTIELRCDVLDILLVLLVNLSYLADLLLLLFDFRVVLLNTVHEPFTRLRERQIHLVSLQFQVLLPLAELGLRISKMLCALLKGISPQTLIRNAKTLVDILQLLSTSLNFGQELLVVPFVDLVIVALLRV